MCGVGCTRSAVSVGPRFSSSRMVRKSAPCHFGLAQTLVVNDVDITKLRAPCIIRPQSGIARFRGCGLREGRTWREGVLGAPKMQRNQEISSRSTIPTRERLTSRERESAWQNLRRRAAHDCRCYTAKDPRLFTNILQRFFSRELQRAKNSNARKHGLPRSRKCLVQIVLHPGRPAFSEGSRNSKNTKTSFDGKNTESAETVVDSASSRCDCWKGLSDTTRI